MDPFLSDVLLKDAYVYPTSRYISGHIVEYDIRAANVNMLYKYGKIDKATYDYLLSIPKQDRQVKVGLMSKQDPTINTIYINGIKEHKLLFAEANNIQLKEVIRIAKDAVYINRPGILQNRFFGNVEFKIASITDVFMILENKVYILFKKEPDGSLNIDVKGLGESKALHADGMLSFIASLINIVENAGVEEGLKMISDFYVNYINKNLPIQFYRHFDSRSEFLVNAKGLGSVFVPVAKQEDLYLLNIDYNAKVIRDIWSVIKSKYRY